MPRPHGEWGMLRERLQRAFAAQQAGRLEQAEQGYREVLAEEPDQPMALLNLGTICFARGDHAQAMACCKRLIERHPHFADAYNNLGAIQEAQGQYNEALHLYQQAIQRKPDYAQAHANLGGIHRLQRRHHEALDCFTRAVELQPTHSPFWIHLGNTHKTLDRPGEALDCYARALAIDPHALEARLNRAATLLMLDRPSEAAEECLYVLNQRQEWAEALFLLGSARQAQERFAEAAECQERALAHQPDYAEAWNSLGVIRHVQGRFSEASNCFTRATELKPDHAEAQFNRAMNLLLRGEFQAGWTAYEWRRFQKGVREPELGCPLWDGEDLNNKTIVIRAEQGLGDTIQFIRYGHWLQDLGARVIAIVPHSLKPLLQSYTGVESWSLPGETTPAADVWCPLLSLPSRFGSNCTDLPAKVPYLHAEESRVEYWRSRLARWPGLRVGITWQGNPQHKADRFRSLPLDAFAPLAELPGVQLISLQKGPGTDQLDLWHGATPIHTLGEEVDQDGAFLDTAAVMQSLDLVVTSDTAAAHLAGAMAIPTRVVLSASPDWRWLLGRDDSPWYPTMRLYRQRRLGDWAEVFARLQHEIAAWARQGRKHG